MDSIFGLPAHPFFVHVPLVLIPLVCIGVIAIAVRPVWRRRFGWIIAGASALMVVATFLAVSSGEAFDDRLDNAEPIQHHRELAETSRLLVIALFVVVLALVLVGRYCDSSTKAAVTLAWMPALMTTLAVVAIAAAALSTVWIARTGHEGTKVVWRSLIEEDDDR